jgi:hypothetical protein
MQKSRPNVRGQLGRQKNAGRKILVPLERISRSYLFMESLPIEPPLSIFTLIMWMEFLSA